MRHTKILEDGSILIATPNHYTVNSYKSETIEKIKDIASTFDNSCKFLYNILKVLGIDKKQAKEQDLTLNIQTGDYLYEIACKRPNVSHEIRKLIKTYDW